MNALPSPAPSLASDYAAFPGPHLPAEHARAIVASSYRVLDQVSPRPFSASLSPGETNKSTHSGAPTHSARDPQRIPHQGRRRPGHAPRHARRQERRGPGTLPLGPHRTAAQLTRRARPAPRRVRHAAQDHPRPAPHLRRRTGQRRRRRRVPDALAVLARRRRLAVRICGCQPAQIGAWVGDGVGVVLARAVEHQLRAQVVPPPVPRRRCCCLICTGRVVVTPPPPPVCAQTRAALAVPRRARRAPRPAGRLSACTGDTPEGAQPALAVAVVVGR